MLSGPSDCRRVVRIAGVVVVALTLLGWPRARSAAASVSIPLTFDDLLARASAVAVVTPLDRRGVWEGGRIATYTHVRVERTIAGRLSGDIWVRTQGGAVGHVGQIVEGEATFPPGRSSLVFLDPRKEGPATSFGVVEGAQGQFLIVTHGDAPPRLATSQGMGGILPASSAQRLARDVFVDTALEDAANIIVAAWSRSHPASPEAP